MRLKKFLPLLLSVTMLLTGCADTFKTLIGEPTSSDYIQIVKNCTFSNYNSSLGDVFDSLFTDTSWEHYYSTKDAETVTFKGDCLYDGQHASFMIQFEVDYDTADVVDSYADINNVKTTSADRALILEKIFNHYGEGAGKLDLATNIFSPQAAIETVYTGYPLDYPHLSFGEVFDDYFEYTTWEYFESSDGYHVVEFSGVRLITSSRYASFEVQFLIEEDLSGFKTYCVTEEYFENTNATYIKNFIDDIFKQYN